MLGESVISDLECPELSFAEVLKADRRNVSDARVQASQNPAVACHDLILIVYQDGDIKPKGLDTAGDLFDLLPSVASSILRVELQLYDRAIRDRQSMSGSRALCA
jgi:hypothetical protein